MEDLLTSAINQWSSPEETASVVLIGVINMKPSALGVPMDNNAKNLFQDLRNLKAGRTLHLRTDAKVLFESVSPGTIDLIKTASPFPLLPISKGRVLDLLRHEYSKENYLAVSEKLFGIIDASRPELFLNEYLLMLAACDQDLIERQAPKRYFQELIKEWMEDSSVTFSKRFLNSVIHYDFNGLGEIAAEMKWPEKNFQRLRNFKQEGNWRLPPLVDFKRMFEAIFRLRIKRGSLPKKLSDSISELAWIVTGQLACAAGLDKLRDKVEDSDFISALENFEKCTAWVTGQNTLT